MPPYLLAVYAIIVDRFLKVLAQTGSFTTQPDWFSWTLFKNDGIAFSLPLPAMIFWPLVVILAVTLGTTWRAAWELPAARTAAWFVALGAGSNLYDRLAYGATIDYALFFGRSAVNIADGLILIGLALLYIALRQPKLRAA